MAPKNRTDATNAEAQLNLTAAGLGVVTYRDARIEGLRWRARLPSVRPGRRRRKRRCR
jgi:hypothetical protein